MTEKTLYEKQELGKKIEDISGKRFGNKNES
jgi:hypothetical protein